MLRPRTTQNVPKNSQVVPSSRTGRHVSKSRCEAWTPLSGWEQGDDVAHDIYYLAINAWAKRNAKIRPDAPKGVPSARVWEPFLCTTIHQCSGIPNYEAFVNESLCGRRSVDAVGGESQKGKEKGLAYKKENTPERNADIQDEGLSSRRVDNDNEPESKDTEIVSEEQKIKGNISADLSSVPVSEGTIILAPTPLEGDEGEDGDGDNTPNQILRSNTSRSAPVSRTPQRAPSNRRVGSAKSGSSEDRLGNVALRNATKSNATQKISAPPNPVQLSINAISGIASPRTGIFAGDLPLNDDVEAIEPGSLDDCANVWPTAADGIKRRTSMERRMLIEEALRDSKRIEYIPNTSHVSIGDLLSSTSRLERRLGQNNHNRGRAYASLMNSEEMPFSSAESFGGRPSPKQNGSPSPCSESSLPPVPSGVNNFNLILESNSSSDLEGRKADVRAPMNLTTARIPVMSYSKAPPRRGVDDGEKGREIKKDKKLDDTPYVKYSDSIMSAIQETTVELESDISNLQADSDRERNRTVSHVLGQQRSLRRGPSAFRPHSFKTPLQRAVENAHKKIYGQHYLLFAPNSSTQGAELSEDLHNAHEVTDGHSRGLRSWSANGEVESAFVWKEHIASHLRQKRKSECAWPLC